MNTPICDFVRAYQRNQPLRLHMPGHKGKPVLGPEGLDITEIAGADELYHARGVIRQSEENASSLFGTGSTMYSAEGSSLCIRAMVYLALLHGNAQGRNPLILAGRNAHRVFLSACALLDADVEWIYPEREESLISCEITAAGLDRKLAHMPEKPVAVYVTSPDYLGHMTNISALSAVCRRHDVLLLVDNAHGAYLKFLPEDRHPITLGADLCCDSAHKTLPVLTGGAYLHIRKNAPSILFEHAERALSLFASTSPSYLILQSLDACNAYLAGAYRQELSELVHHTAQIKKRLIGAGYALVGDEPIKLTLAPKSYGYTGDELHALLRARNMECEFSDPDFVTMMLTPALNAEELRRLETALLHIPRKPALSSLPPPLPRPRRVLSIREALLGPSQEVSVGGTLGRVLADAQLSCPPCIPILACGEEIDEAALACFRYYGIDACRVTDEHNRVIAGFSGHTA